jgi:predicted nucleic acid-binding protein
VIFRDGRSHRVYAYGIDTTVADRNAAERPESASQNSFLIPTSQKIAELAAAIRKRAGL